MYVQLLPGKPPRGRRCPAAPSSSSCCLPPSLHPALYLILSDLSTLVMLSVFFPIAWLAPLLQHP